MSHNDLDFRIAETIMGWIPRRDPRSGDGQGWFWFVPGRGEVQGTWTPRYSSDISKAWEVVEKLASLPDESVRQRFVTHLLAAGFLVNKDIAARNICLAALSAITDDEEADPAVAEQGKPTYSADRSNA